MHGFGSSQELSLRNPEVHGGIPVIDLDTGGAAGGTLLQELTAAELELAVPCAGAVGWRVEAGQDMGVAIGTGTLGKRRGWMRRSAVHTVPGISLREDFPVSQHTWKSSGWSSWLVRSLRKQFPLATPGNG